MPIPLADAIAVTGATTGQVPCEVEVTIPDLTAAQKTALLAFVTSLGTAWPGSPGNLWGISINRRSLAATKIDCSLRGVVVHANAAAAIAGQTAGSVIHIIGSA